MRSALAAGVLLTCAFAPLNLWPLAILCPAVLMWLWEGASPRRAAWSGFWFGAGTFAFGTWWLYISIHDVAQAPILLALGLVLALVLIMAAYHALLGFLAAWALPASGPWRWLVGLPSLWLLIEWWRGWFFSGFPWLSLGYSQTDTVLAGFAPVLGVYGLSALLLVGSGALLALLRGTRTVRLVAAALLLLPWPLGAALERVNWTHPDGPPVSVAILQGAVPQDLKWQEDNVEPTRELYTRLNAQALGARLIIWPEAALTQLANEIPRYLGQQYSQARMRGSDIVMGILRVDEKDRYYNSILTMADKVSFYDKHPSGAVRRILPGARIHPLMAGVHEPAVLGLHAWPCNPAHRRCRRHPPGAGHLLRGRLRQHEPAGAGQRGTAGQRYQRRLVRPFLGAASAFPDRPHARHRGAAAAIARRQRRHIGAGGRARGGAGAGRTIQAHGTARNRTAARWSTTLCPHRKLAYRGSEPGGPGCGHRHETPPFSGTGTLPGLSLTTFFDRSE
jgi:hypothetical protein